MLRAHLMLLAVLLPYGATCGSSSPSHVLAAKNYDRKCTTVADCVPIFEGTVGCCGPGCPNTAISAASLPKFMSDLEMASHCDVHPRAPRPREGVLRARAQEGRDALREGRHALDDREERHDARDLGREQHDADSRGRALHRRVD